MNIRPKTVRRLVLLLAVCGLMALAAASVLFYSRKSKEKLRPRTTDGSHKAGNYSLALENFHLHRPLQGRLRRAWPSRSTQPRRNQQRSPSVEAMASSAVAQRAA
jgi:hypothetical protein